MDWSLRKTKFMPQDRNKLRKKIQALPLIFAHHQRTPTNRKRQSWKNSGGFPSKAWPMNWRIHPKTKRANASHHRR